jgi:hypothetical protein
MFDFVREVGNAVIWHDVLGVVLAAVLVALIGAVWYGVFRDLRWLTGGLAGVVVIIAAFICWPHPQPMPSVSENSIHNVAIRSESTAYALSLTVCATVVTLPAVVLAFGRSGRQFSWFVVLLSLCTGAAVILVSLHTRRILLDVDAWYLSRMESPPRSREPIREELLRDTHTERGNEPSR